MGFTNVFGGQLLFPSQLSYLSITTAVDVTLQWPTEQQIEGVNVVADFLDIDATVAALNIDMPAATATSTGNKTTINNIGANTFTVRDSTGGTIQSIAAGEAWVIVLRDNTTAAGLWRTFQLGASVSVASASALAGAGLKAIGALLNQKIDSDVEAVTPFTVVDGDRAKCLIYTAGAGTANLTAAATVGNDWFFMLRNSGTGTLNVLPPAGTIDGGASINLDPNDSAIIFTDGTDYFTVGLSSGSTIAFDFVSIAIPGSGDFVLSGANLNRISYRFTGALTGNRRIVVPNTTQQYWVDNQTTGAFTLEISTVAQVGPPQVTQAESIILYCDATDVVNASTSTSVAFPITIGQGGTGQTTAALALAALGGVPTARLINTNALSGLAGGGDLSADRSIVLNTDDLTVENTIDGALDTLPFWDDDAGAQRKTIFNTLGLPLPTGAAVSLILRSDGAGLWAAAGAGFTVGATGIARVTSVSFFFDDGVDNLGFFPGSGALQVNPSAGWTDIHLNVENLRVGELAANGGSVYVSEKAAANADIATYGQLWIQNDVPNSLMFTDDAGNDQVVARGNAAQPTFSPTFTGFGTPPSNAITYTLSAGIVTLSCNAGNTATSNATTMTMTGIPTEIRPNVTTSAALHILQDNSLSVVGSAVINAAGTVTFGVTGVPTGFTASGLKGLPGNWSMTYPLDGG